MSGSRIIRKSESTSVVIPISTATSSVFVFDKYATMMLHMPAGWTSASIGFLVSITRGGTYTGLYDDDGNLAQVDSPEASRSYAAPSPVAGITYAKLWSQNGSGANTTQSAARTINITMKG